MEWRRELACSATPIVRCPRSENHTTITTIRGGGEIDLEHGGSPLLSLAEVTTFTDDMSPVPALGVTSPAAGAVLQAVPANTPANQKIDFGAPVATNLPDDVQWRRECLLSLRQRCDRLESQLTLLTSENEGLERHVLELQNMHRDTSLSRDDRELECQELNAVVDRLSETLRKREAELKVLADNQSASVEENRELRRQLREAAARASRVESVECRLQAQVVSLKVQLAEYQAVLDRLELKPPFSDVMTDNACLRLRHLSVVPPSVNSHPHPTLAHSKTDDFSRTAQPRKVPPQGSHGPERGPRHLLNSKGPPLRFSCGNARSNASQPHPREDAT